MYFQKRIQKNGLSKFRNNGQVKYDLKTGEIVIKNFKLLFHMIFNQNVPDKNVSNKFNQLFIIFTFNKLYFIIIIQKGQFIKLFFLNLYFIFKPRCSDL